MILDSNGKETITTTDKLRNRAFQADHKGLCQAAMEDKLCGVMATGVGVSTVRRRPRLIRAMSTWPSISIVSVPHWRSVRGILSLVEAGIQGKEPKRFEDGGTLCAFSIREKSNSDKVQMKLESV